MIQSRGSNYVKVKDGDPIIQHVSPLAYHNGNTSYCFGTAVIIAPHLALTAKHVIEEYIRQSGINVLLEANTDVGFHLLVMQRSEDGDATWFVRRIYMSSATDVALLFLDPGNEIAANGIFQKRLMILLHPPYPGVQVAGFGYPGSKITKNAVNDYALDLNGHTTAGTVGTVYRSRRDSNLNFPCFEVNARIDGGMSGGPIFSDKGRLLGLMCTGWDFADGKSYLGYVACLWPLMAMLIDIPREDRPSNERYRLIELAKTGVLGVEDWEKIDIEINGDGTETYVFRSNPGFAKYSE